MLPTSKGSARSAERVVPDAMEIGGVGAARNPASSVQAFRRWVRCQRRRPPGAAPRRSPTRARLGAPERRPFPLAEAARHHHSPDVAPIVLAYGGSSSTASAVLKRAPGRRRCKRLVAERLRSSEPPRRGPRGVGTSRSTTHGRRQPPWESSAFTHEEPVPPSSATRRRACQPIPRAPSAPTVLTLAWPRTVRASQRAGADHRWCVSRA